jgi:hypothetical protein
LKVTVIVKLGIEAAKRELGNLKQPASWKLEHQNKPLDFSCNLGYESHWGWSSLRNWIGKEYTKKIQIEGSFRRYRNTCISTAIRYQNLNSNEGIEKYFWAEFEKNRRRTNYFD